MWLTVNQVADQLQVHPETVREWARRHIRDVAARRKCPRGLRSYRLGNRYRFKQSDVEGVFK